MSLCVRGVTETQNGPEQAISGTVCDMTRVRLDALLAERGTFPSRTAAAQAIRAGEVRFANDGPIALKPGQMVEAEAELQVAEKQRFASRGGEKLENALRQLGIEAQGRECLDVGASTGGFTDCLLQNGATRVIALDVAYGQLDDRLRQDPRVVELNRVNARALEPADLPFTPDLITVDVSFISLTKVLPAVVACLADRGEVLAMVKPQFELGRSAVGRGGVVRDLDLRRKAIRDVAGHLHELDLKVRGFAFSGLPGPKGNRETFIWAGRDGEAIRDFDAALEGMDI